ncbi:MAG: MerR family transcriptional regulator [Myxococcales bacterium]|nr:MerR family transcriptional regulator [Myxococcales bacterium]
MADDRDEHWTIDELARRVDTTTRNIRAYQARRILHPPIKQGRTGYYDRTHLARLQLILRLLKRGYSLSAIAEMLDAWQSGRGVEDLLGLEGALSAPWAEERPEPVDTAEIEARYPGLLERPDLLAKMAEAKLLARTADGWVTPRPKLFESGVEFLRAGISLEKSVDTYVFLTKALGMMADYVLALLISDVWDAFVAAGQPAEGWARVSDALVKLRELAPLTAGVGMSHELDERIPAVTERIVQSRRRADEGSG